MRRRERRRHLHHGRAPRALTSREAMHAHAGLAGYRLIKPRATPHGPSTAAEEVSGSARGLPGDGGLRWGVSVGGSLRYWEVLQPHSYWGAVGDRRQNGELEKARLLSIGTNT